MGFRRWRWRRAAGAGYNYGGGGHGGQGACYNWSGANRVWCPYFSNPVEPGSAGLPASINDVGFEAYIDSGCYAYTGQGGRVAPVNGVISGGVGGSAAGKAGENGANTYPNSVTSTSYKTICFNANGGSSNSYTMTTGNTVNTLPATNPTRDGYTFKGWNTNASGTGSTVSTSTTLGSTVNTYYAVWTLDTYNAVITVLKDSVPWWTSAPSNIVLSTSSTSAQTGQITTSQSDGVYTFSGIPKSTTLYVWAKNNAGAYVNKGTVSASVTAVTVYYYDITLTAGTGIQSVSGTELI